MVLTRAHAALAANETEVAERFRQYCLPTFREGWCALRGPARLAHALPAAAMSTSLSACPCAAFEPLCALAARPALGMPPESCVLREVTAAGR
jgi:hypothetical protein